MSTENENNNQNEEGQNSFDIASFNESFETSFEDFLTLKQGNKHTSNTRIIPLQQTIEMMKHFLF